MAWRRRRRASSASSGSAACTNPGVRRARAGPAAAADPALPRGSGPGRLPTGRPSMPPVQRRHTFSIGYFVLVALGLVWLQSILAPQMREIPYSEFRQMLGKGWVEKVVLSDSLIRGELKPEHAGEQKSFVTVRV